MDPAVLEEEDIFRAVAKSGARAILFGRRALIALGIPVGTFDYDFWIPADDAAALNAALEPLGFWPNRSPDEARKVGRYMLENSTRVDVLIARAVSTVDGHPVHFEDVWSRRQMVEARPGVLVALPSIDDLIATKQFGRRSKDRDDIRLLELLREKLGQ